MKVCQCCSRLFPAGQLLTACSCRREACRDCLIPIYADETTVLAGMVGYLCIKCAAHLVVDFPRFRGQVKAHGSAADAVGQKRRVSGSPALSATVARQCTLPWTRAKGSRSMIDRATRPADLRPADILSANLTQKERG